MNQTQYLVTEAQKNAINAHLPSGSQLFVYKNGSWYMSKQDIDYLRAKDSLFDLIIKTEFSVTDVQGWVDALDEFSFDSVERAAEAGFNAYRELIARINNGGGLTGNPATLDTGIMVYIGYTGDVNQLVVPMTGIRDMLKDGFFEYALRSIQHYSDPRATGVTVEMKAENVATIRSVAKENGRDDNILDFAQLTGKGSLV